MYPGLPSRLEKELRALYLKNVLKGDKTRLSKFKLRIEDPPRRKHMVFLGGSVLADIMKDRPGMHRISPHSPHLTSPLLSSPHLTSWMSLHLSTEFWISKAEWAEHGTSRPLLACCFALPILILVHGFRSDLQATKSSARNKLVPVSYRFVFFLARARVSCSLFCKAPAFGMFRAWRSGS
jgi:hypothetical protein